MNNQHFTQQIPENELRDELFKALMEELSAYEYLMETMEEKKQAIIENNLRQIEQLSGTEQLLVTKVNRLTETRYHLMQNYFQAHHINNFPITLMEFIRLTNEKERAIWEKVSGRLNKILNQIHLINLENKQLLESSLKYIQGMINLFLPQDENLSDIYSPEGNGNEKHAVKNLLDCNA